MHLPRLFRSRPARLLLAVALATAAAAPVLAAPPSDADVNRLLKQYQQMEKMMSKLGSGGMKGVMRQMSGAMRQMGGGGFMPRR